MHHALKKMKFQDVGQKIREEIVGQRDELTQIDSGDFTNQRFDHVIVRNSISTYVFYVVLAIGLTIFLLLPSDTGVINFVELFEANWFWAIVVGLLPITLLYFSLRSALDRTPKLTVDLKGIKTSEWEVTWHDIVETKFRSLKGKTTLLIVKTRDDEKTVDIGNTNVVPCFLGHHIELLKRRAG